MLTWVGPAAVLCAVACRSCCWLQVQAAMLINSDLPGVTLQQQQGAPQRPMRCA
jgi:hypothetical protein